MQIRKENIPPLSVVYMRRIGPYGEQNYELMQVMKQWVKENNLWTENGVIYAIAQDNAETTSPERCRYDVCFVTETSTKDSSVYNGALPSGNYLIFEIPHTVSDVQQFYASIGEHLFREQVQFDSSRPILERYQFQLVENGYCEFCVPVL